MKDKIYYHIIEESKFDCYDIGYQGFCTNKEDADETIKSLEEMFSDISYFYIFTSDNDSEPVIITN